MRLYETTFVLDSQLEDSIIEEQIERVTNFLKSKAEEIVKIEKRGIRKLAYEIKKRQQGFFVFVHYKAKTGVVAEFEREMRLNEAILRYLTVVSDGGSPSVTSVPAENIDLLSEEE